jgi:hemolysin activation/secretion protein
MISFLSFTLRVGALAYLLFSSARASSPQATPPRLTQILLAESIEAAVGLTPQPTEGYLVISTQLAFLDRAELLKRLQPGEGQLIDERLLAGIALVIEGLARESDYAAATAVIPPQNIRGGVVRVAVLPGKIRDVRLQSTQWFSESLLREKLRLERGETVRLSDLNRSLAWANSNPFRRLRVHVEPVAGTGEADLVVNVEERRPIRLLAAYDNTGNSTLGLHRYTAGVTFGNAWGWDHQASYHFLTSNEHEVFQAHIGEYRVPLKWRHFLSIGGSYVSATPTILEDFTQEGESITTDVKYIVPLNRGKWQAEGTFSLGYKHTNNNLEYGGIPQIGATIDVFTATLGASAIRADKKGNWLLSANVVASPGTLNSRSERQIYHESRLGANPRFVYGTATIQRNTVLTPTTLSVAKALVQLSSANLVPTEQLSFGGMSTVRGYEERILSGDAGYSFSHEVQQRLRTFTLGKPTMGGEISGVAFWDYGRISAKFPELGRRASDYLASAGVGLRVSVGSYLSAAVDYARQLEKVELPGVDHDRFHVRVTISY